MAVCASPTSGPMSSRSAMVENLPEQSASRRVAAENLAKLLPCRRAARRRSRWTQLVRGSALRLVRRAGVHITRMCTTCVPPAVPSLSCACHAVGGLRWRRFAVPLVCLSHDLSARCPGGLGGYIGQLFRAYSRPELSRSCRPVLHRCRAHVHGSCGRRACLCVTTICYVSIWLRGTLLNTMPLVCPHCLGG